MLNISRLSKIFQKSGALLSNGSLYNNPLSGYTMPIFNSLVHKNAEYFGRAKIPKSEKKKEKTSAPAFSDDKAAKLSKAEEEAEAKKKKAEEEKAKAKKEKHTLPIRSQLPVFEAKFDAKRLEEEADRIKKKGLFLIEEEDLNYKFTEPALKEWPQQEIVPRTINDVVRKETPSLKRKVSNNTFSKF